MSEERYCGNCCWFSGEDHYGYGLCPFRFGDAAHCGDECTNNEFISKKEIRHHMAVLVQTTRFWEHYPSERYRYPKAKEIKEAIKFAYKYIKAFSKL